MMCDYEVSQVFIRGPFFEKEKKKKANITFVTETEEEKRGKSERRTLETETGTQRKVELTGMSQDLHFKSVLSTALLQLSLFLHV